LAKPNKCTAALKKNYQINMEQQKNLPMEKERLFDLINRLEKPIQLGIIFKGQPPDPFSTRFAGFPPTCDPLVFSIKILD
jgi:hypothetical protein